MATKETNTISVKDVILTAKNVKIISVYYVDKVWFVIRTPNACNIVKMDIMLTWPTHYVPNVL